MSELLILASGSPRRREFLTDLGLTFEVRPADVDETPLPGEIPGATARRLAIAKAQALAADGHTVLGADTVVAMDGHAIGKPADADEARAMLKRLRSRPHEVVTAVAVVRNGKTYANGATTGVAMRDYTDDEIEAYVASGDPLDKAGAYAIQNLGFHPVQMWNGCYCNVVGLPLALTAALLHQSGYPLEGLVRPRQCSICPGWDPR